MNNRLNEYLSEVETRLRHLPDIDREQEVTEVAQHLETLISAQQSEGQSEEAATVAAITQFGAAHEIGKRLYQTGRRQRLAPLLEVGLFGVAFSNLNWWANQLFIRSLQLVVSPSIAPNLDAHLTHWPLTGWPISGSIGVAALAILVMRYGIGGMWQKAWSQTPTGAAVRWQFFRFFIGTVPPYFLAGSLYRVASFSSLTPSEQMGVIGLSNALSLFLAFMIAFFVGRSSRSRASVADAIGCSAAVGTAVALLQMAFQFVPVPWHRAPLASFAVLAPFFLNGFLTVAVCGILGVFLSRWGVVLGESSRPLTEKKQTI